MVALYRPGPMQHIPTYIRAKHGLETVQYPHPDLSEVLDETYGVIVYQDQVLLIAQKFAGYSLGQADVMRKAMGKKVRAMMRAEEDRFRAGAAEKGYTPELAKQIYDLIEPFAGYAFNKAHAVSYGTIAYQTAYLKANYPAEYMTAVMMMAGDQKRVAEAYAECVRLGIAVLAPDVNRSAVNFALEKSDGVDCIRFGLASVKNVGEGVSEGIIENRTAAGTFATLEQVFERVDVRHLNKRALESLVKAGAFDTLAERNALLASLDRLIGYAQREQKQRESGQTSLFALMGEEAAASVQGPQLESATEATQQQKLTWEKELLGIYLSEHPFARVAEELRGVLTCGLVEVSADFHNRELLIGGVVAGLRSLSTRDGRQFLAAELEDMTGSLEVTVWPESWEQTRDIWQPGNIVIANVRVKARDDRLQLSVQKAALYGDPAFDLNELLTSSPGANGNGYRRNGGNGGGTNGNGSYRTRASSVPAPAPTPRSSALSIVLEETDDEDGDHERLRALLATIGDYSGEAKARLAIRQRDGEEVVLDLPPVRQCPELTQILGDIVGPWGTVAT
jgi:DNA polymerase-3 subunit alpha